MPTHDKPAQGHHTSRCKHWSGSLIAPARKHVSLPCSSGEDHAPHKEACFWSQAEARPLHQQMQALVRPVAGSLPSEAHRLPPSKPCQHITSLGEATIPADANTGRASHCAHKEACFPFILLWRRSCTPKGGMLLVTSPGEATIPADANTGKACRRVVAVGSSPAYHRLSHANT